jgi:hypothetical protein
MRAPSAHAATGAEPAPGSRMDGALYPRFARWLDFIIVLAVGMWCL